MNNRNLQKKPVPTRDEQQRTGIGAIDLITCGYFDCSKFENLTLSPRRQSSRFEIEYYLKDGLTTTVDDTEYLVRKDYIMITEPGQYRFSCLPFHTMYLKFSADGSLAERLKAAPKYFLVIDTHKIRELFSAAILLYDSPDKDLLFHSRVLELIYLILSASLLSDVSRNVNLDIADSAKKYIDEHYAEPLSLRDIAETVSLSPNYFHTVFKTTCGMTPHEYLLNRRISASKEMLWHSDARIPEIAEKCGFGCQQYFTQAFRKHTGITPGKYQKKLQQDYLT